MNYLLYLITFPFQLLILFTAFPLLYPFIFPLSVLVSLRNLYINLAGLFVCQSVCLYPINVKTTKPIGPKFCLGPRMTPGKVFGCSELGTFEWWISGLILDPIFILISRINNACSPHVINLQIN